MRITTNARAAVDKNSLVVKLRKTLAKTNKITDRYMILRSMLLIFSPRADSSTFSSGLHLLHWAHGWLRWVISNISGSGSLHISPFTFGWLGLVKSSAICGETAVHQNFPCDSLSHGHVMFFSLLRTYLKMNLKAIINMVKMVNRWDIICSLYRWFSKHFISIYWIYE